MQLERMLVDTSTRIAWGRLSNGKKVQVGIDDISEGFTSYDDDMSKEHHDAFEIMSDLVKEQVSE
jgi:hypothetical protein